MRALVNSITRWDMVWLTAIFGLSGRSVIARLMPGISKSGNGGYYFLLALLLLALDPSKGLSFLLTALAGFAIELPTYKIIKQSVKRGRPCEILPGVHGRVVPSDRFSFPSGHTAAAFVIATLLGHIYPALIPLTCSWALAVGLSRIYLGVHYPTDVLAGMMIGILSAICGLSLAG